MTCAGVLLCGLAAGCTPQARDDAAALPVKPPPAPGCPTLPTPSVRITGEQGVDFWTCHAQDAATRTPLFDVYVGNHPGTPHGLQYAGTSQSRHGRLAWFSTRAPGARGRRTWYTYLPTGNRSAGIMVVSFTTGDLGVFKARADLIAHLEIGT